METAIAIHQLVRNTVREILRGTERIHVPNVLRVSAEGAGRFRAQHNWLPDAPAEKRGKKPAARGARH
jgi:hypothetical protein